MHDDFDDMSREDWEQMQGECEDLHQRRAEAFQASVKNHACHHYSHLGDFLVGRWISVVELIDELGDRHLSVMGSPNLEPWEAVGMIRSIEP